VIRRIAHRFFADRRTARVALTVGYVGYAIATAASLLGRRNALWLPALDGVILGVLITCHYRLRQIWRWQDARVDELRPSCCEICGNVNALRLNSQWFCAAHLDEGIHRTIKLVAMQRDIPDDVIEMGERFVRQVLSEYPGGGDVEFGMRRIEGDEQ
jgi:hypothetical protein